MENILFLGVPILKHIRVTTVAPPAFLAELFPLVIFLIEIVLTL